MLQKKVSPESQKTEYKSSWQDEYFEWICGYANSKGGKLYIGVNDDGYVVGLNDTRYLLDILPNQVTDNMGIVIEVDHDVVFEVGTNIKYSVVPEDIAEKPENLYVRGILTEKAVDDINADPDNTKNVTADVQKLFDAAPGFVKQLRQNADYRNKIKLDIATWDEEHLVRIGADGSLEYVMITAVAYPFGISYRNHYFTRPGGTTKELKGIALSAFLLDRAGKHWDGMPMPGMKVTDLDPAVIESYRKKAIDNGRHTLEEVSVSDEQIVSDLKLIDDRAEGDGDILRAAVLMFHPDPEKYVVGASVKVAYFAPEGAYGANKADDIIYHDEVHGPLMLQVDKVVDLVYTKYLKALVSYDGLQRIETFMTPKETFREVVLNAVNHKVYESGNPIQISVYEDKIIVFNQGCWPDDIDLDELYVRKHSSYPHNPSLSTTFFNAGDIEAYGSGFGKIRIACDRVGAPYPELEITPNGVTVVIKACDLYMKLLKHGRYWETYPDEKEKVESELTDEKGNAIVDSNGDAIIATEVRDVDPDTIKSLDRMSEILSKSLTDREKGNILPIYEYLKCHENIDLSKTMDITGKSKSTAGRYLQKLTELKVLSKHGESVSTYYTRMG